MMRRGENIPNADEDDILNEKGLNAPNKAKYKTIRKRVTSMQSNLVWTLKGMNDIYHRGGESKTILSLSRFRDKRNEWSREYSSSSVRITIKTIGSSGPRRTNDWLTGPAGRILYASVDMFYYDHQFCGLYISLVQNSDTGWLHSGLVCCWWTSCVKESKSGVSLPLVTLIVVEIMSLIHRSRL